MERPTADRLAGEDSANDNAKKLVDYFRKRFRFNVQFMWLLVGGFLGGILLMILPAEFAASVLTSLVLALVVVVEMVVEPRRSEGMDFQPDPPTRL